MHTKIWKEQVGDQLLAVEVNAPLHLSAEDSKPSVLLLHGAGESHRGRSQYLVDTFTAHGLTCLRFDFSGHGESSGDLREASLARRLIEARTLADKYLDPHQPLMVCGTSMGGHVASQLTQHLNIAHLILCCPAAYDAAAETVPFGYGFTEIIRAAGSQARSGIWDLLAQYTGKASQIIGTADTIIPASVSNSYDFALMHTDYVRLDVEGAPHSLYEWLPENPEWLEAVQDVLLR